MTPIPTPNAYKPNRIKFSCHGCEERRVGCHAECEEYKAEKQEVHKAYKAQLEGASKNSMLNKYEKEQKRKNALYPYERYHRNRKK